MSASEDRDITNHIAVYGYHPDEFEKAITLLEACYCFPDYPKCEYCQLIDAMLDINEEIT